MLSLLLFFSLLLSPQGLTPLSLILMACLDMYNNKSPHQPPTPMSPRISFSNDFVESHNSQHLVHHQRSEPPVSSDFEFSVTNFNMMTSTADELFSKGRILPFKDNNNNIGSNSQMQRTLRDELLVNDDIEFSTNKPPKGSSSSSSSSTNRWKGLLGLRKSHIGSKKPAERSDFSYDAPKRFSFSYEDANLTNTPQDMVSNDGPSSSDVEMGYQLDNR